MKREHDLLPEQLFARALELEVAERASFLDELARTRPDVARELASLLACQVRTGDFLERPLPFQADARAADLPAHIGPYRVIGLLGEGGMGVVYLAEQERPRRTVALKVLRSALASPDQRARFEREAELLGRLAHRGIARIYEAGVADAGAGPQPYFAMEHVRGRALDEWLGERRASPRECLALLAEVCEAVEHAHRHGVVHRDLKPANVLVDDGGGAPEVKVLDFGVARALDVDASARDARTARGQLVGTLPYMSPEQAAGDPDAVGARSDVYALGVMAYELVSGRRPYELEGLSLIEAVRVIREREPEPLANRSRALRGDVETIVGKALAKEPERRYASAGELGADLRRWLDGRAVLARPPSRADQFVRLARRHKALFGGFAATLVALAAGLAVALHQNALLREQRDRVAEEARGTRAVAAWFEELLGQASPWQGARDVSLLEVLERGGQSLSEEVRAAPAIEARVRAVLGMTFAGLGELERAEAELAVARERALAAHGSEHETSLVVLARQGHVALRRDRLDEAQRMLEEAYAGLVRLSGAGSVEALVASDGLARCLQARGRVEEAEAMMRADLAAQEALGAPSRSEALTAANNLASLLVAVGRFDEAIELLEPALAEGRALDGDRHPNSLMKANNLATALVRAGRTAEALPVLEELHAAADEVLGPEHPDALTCRMNLGRALDELGRSDEALVHLRAVADQRAQLLGEDHAATLTARNNLAAACARAGRFEEAIDLYLGVLADFEAAPDGGGMHAALTLQNLALVRLDLGEPEQACADFEQALAAVELALGPDDWQVASVRANYATALHSAGRVEDAERELDFALPILERALGPDHPRVRAAAAYRNR